jgi:hypothetical protein
MDVGVVLELPAPRMQDTGETRELCPDETLVLGEPFEGERRGCEHGLGGEALMGADQGAQGLRDSAGDEEVRPRELCVEVRMEPLLGFMLLTLGTVAVATGMIDAVWSPTALALREAMAIVPALALLESAYDLSVRGGTVGRALQGLWCEGMEEVTQGAHGRSPCLRAGRRS